MNANVPNMMITPRFGRSTFHFDTFYWWWF